MKANLFPPEDSAAVHHQGFASRSEVLSSPTMGGGQSKEERSAQRTLNNTALDAACRCLSPPSPPGPLPRPFVPCPPPPLSPSLAPAAPRAGSCSVPLTFVLKHRHLQLVPYSYGRSKAAKSNCKPSLARAHLSFMQLLHYGKHSDPIFWPNSGRVCSPAAACL